MFLLLKMLCSLVTVASAVASHGGKGVNKDNIMFLLLKMLCSLVTAQPQRDVLSCTELDQTLHYSLDPYTHTINLSLDQPGYDAGSQLLGPGLSAQQPCKLSLVACDECRIEIVIRDARNHWDCGHVFLDQSEEQDTHPKITPRQDICDTNCSFLFLYEPAYGDVSMTYFRSAINNIITYNSISSRVNIETCYHGWTKPAAPVEIEVVIKDKMQKFSGSASGDVTSGSFMSPNFPEGYARHGEKYLYYIHNTEVGGTIRLNFDDWDIGQNTRILFYDTTKETEYPLSVHYGYYYRPVLHTSGPDLLVLFEPDISSSAPASRAVNFGFKATFEFKADKDGTDIVETDCGGHIRYVTGGTMLYRASHWTSGSKHDCIWVIHKSSAFQHLQLHLWNMSLSALEDDTSVTVHDGLTSLQVLSRVYTRFNASSGVGQQNSTMSPLDTYNNNKGFYVRLRGTLFQNDTFKFTFVSYNNPVNRSSQSQCWRPNEYFCTGSVGSSGMCIDRHFLCDGHAHCPGGQDESSSICHYAHVRPHQRSRGAVLSPVCRPEEFPCISGGRCIPGTAVCDDWRDCPDGSDEYYCDANISKSDYIGVQCTNGTYLCENMCVTREDLCKDKRCALIWYNMGCDIFGVAEPVVEIEWSLILPICFTIFCVFILLGVILIRMRKQPKFYMDPSSRRVRRCRRVPIVSRVIRCHTPCSATSSCSGNSGMGLLSHGTSASGGSSLLDSRPMSPSQFGQYLASPTFGVSTSPSQQAASPCASSMSQQEPNTFFNFEGIQTSVT